MEEHNWKSLLETTKAPKAPSGFKNDILNKIEKLPVNQNHKVQKEYRYIQSLGYFLPELAVLDFSKVSNLLFWNQKQCI